MDLVHAVVLGIVQGLTEFMPISSSAHLVLVPWLLRWDDPQLLGDNALTFDVALHLGTLVAVLGYFWRDWVEIARSLWTSVRERSLGDTRRRLGWFIALATIPGMMAGVILESEAESTFRNPSLIAIMLIALGLLLLFSEYVGRRAKGMDHVSLKDSLLIGVAQAFAVIPGVSRSGSTISAGLLCGLTRDTAARFSFLLGTPIIAGAAAKALYDMAKGNVPSNELPAFGIGIVTSAVVGYFCIGLLLRYLRRNSTSVFVAYRLALGLVVLVAVLAGWIPVPPLS
ncbi:MAG: undecaprenyl-diphosphatase UppP [Chloroflexi bacterium]|nr:undecaprenyl-diphosphatase UppP [Chloroflexota bacterium]